MNEFISTIREHEEASFAGHQSLAPQEIGGNQPAADPIVPESLRLESIERIMCHPRAESHLVARIEDDPVATEHFKQFRYRLKRLRQERALTSLLISSSIPQEGKTTTTVNLAAALAMTSQRCLLIDADLRRPSVHAAMNLSPRPGLTEVLEGRLELSSVLRRVEPYGFFYLSAGGPAKSPLELLESARMQELTCELKSVFEWTLFDSPPLIPFADGHRVAGLCDATLLVVRDGFTPRDDLRRCISSLKGNFIAGIVLNGSADSTHDYYNDYYAAPTSACPGSMPSKPKQFNLWSWLRNG